MAKNTTWNNEFQYYQKPIEDDGFTQFTYDSIVYSLFNNVSYQTAMRGIEYDGEEYDTINNYFWLSEEEVKKAAILNNVEEIIIDLKSYPGQRLVNKILNEITLSDDAQYVLNYATGLFHLTMVCRNQMIKDYSLNAWDAGWYQIKYILQAYLPEELDYFRQIYRCFEIRMAEETLKYKFIDKGESLCK